MKKKLLINKKNIIILTIALCVIGRLIVSPLPINDNLTTGTDQGGYLHYAWFQKAHPFENWDFSWYGGTQTSARFYPPLIFTVQAILANFLSDIISFKLVLLLIFALAPIAFYYLLKEFDLSEKEKLTATAIFTFAMIFNVSFYYGKTSALSSVLFGIIFFKYFIRSLKNKNNWDIAIAGVFLALSILTHLVASVTFIGLVAIYFAAFLFVKFDAKKALRGLFVFISGLILSAYWIIPALVEKNYSYFLLFSDAGQSLYNILPITGIIRTFGYYVNVFTIIMGLIAFILICYGFVHEYKAYKKRNVDSLFLTASTAIFVIGYFLGFYLIREVIVAPEAVVIIWPVFLSMIIAKAVNRRIFSYLTIAFIALLIISFFGIPMQTMSKEYYSRYDGAINYTLSMDGRASFQPSVPYKMTIIDEYRAALLGKEIDWGNFPQGMPANRYNYISDNFGFSCTQQNTVWDRIFSTDFLQREYIKSKPCELINPNLEAYFYSMDVHSVIVGKEFPEVRAYFESEGSYRLVYEDNAAVVYEFTQNPPYLEADKNVTFSYEKLPDKILIHLHSDVEYADANVKISESWYPYWTSKDVENIRADTNGFMEFTVPEISGDKEIVLEFNPPEFYNYLPLITFFWLGVLVLNSKFDPFGLRKS